MRATEKEKQIVADMRHRGMTCREIADDLDTDEYRIWYLSKLAGAQKRRERKPKNIGTIALLNRLLDSYDSVEIERGADDAGYIVSIDGEPGECCDTLKQALVSATKISLYK